MASPHGEAILVFLKRAQREASRLYILGDLFDLWVGQGRAFQRSFEPLILEIKKLKETCEIVYLEGNHDFHLHKFWQDQVGCLVSSGPYDFEFGGYKIRIEHGDENNPEDRGYLFLRWLLRTPVTTALLESLPSGLVKAVGQGASNTSRRHTAAYDHEYREKIKEIMRAYAEKQSRKFSFQVLVTGHTHVADDVTFRAGERDVRLINLGSWFDGPHFLKIDSSGTIDHCFID